MRHPPAFWLATLGAGLVLGGCGSGSSGDAAASAACRTTIAQADKYDQDVRAAKLAAAAAQLNSNSPGVDAARSDQAKLELAWAQVIFASQKCFTAVTVAAAKEYLTGPGR